MMAGIDDIREGIEKWVAIIITADKLNLMVWGFGLFSALILLWAALSWGNLLWAGHTHGGQVGIPFLIEKSNSANKSSFMSGFFDAGKPKMYVNRGIATTHIPLRFFRRPEIAVIEVTRQGALLLPHPCPQSSKGTNMCFPSKQERMA